MADTQNPYFTGSAGNISVNYNGQKMNIDTSKQYSQGTAGYEVQQNPSKYQIRADPAQSNIQTSQPKVEESNQPKIEQPKTDNIQTNQPTQTGNISTITPKGQDIAAANTVDTDLYNKKINGISENLIGGINEYVKSGGVLDDTNRDTVLTDLLKKQGIKVDRENPEFLKSIDDIYANISNNFNKLGVKDWTSFYSKINKKYEHLQLYSTPQEIYDAMQAGMLKTGQLRDIARLNPALYSQYKAYQQEKDKLDQINSYGDLYDTVGGKSSDTTDSIIESDNKSDLTITDFYKLGLSNIATKKTQDWLLTTYDEMKNTPEITEAASVKSEKLKSLLDLKTTIKQIGNDVRSELEGSGATESYIEAKISKRTEELADDYDRAYNEYVMAQDNYNTLVSNANDRFNVFMQQQTLERQDIQDQLNMLQFGYQIQKDQLDREDAEKYNLLDFQQNKALLEMQQQYQTSRDVQNYVNDLNKLQISNEFDKDLLALQQKYADSSAVRSFNNSILSMEYAYQLQQKYPTRSLETNPYDGSQFMWSPTGGIMSLDFSSMSSEYPNNASFKNNNPGNIKYFQGSTMNKILDDLGIKYDVGSQAKDGGNFIKFENVSDGLVAQQELLKQVYGNMTLENAMRKYSGAKKDENGNRISGYGASIAPDINPNTRINQLSQMDMNYLTLQQLKSEDSAMYNELIKSGVIMTKDYISRAETIGGSIASSVKSFVKNLFKVNDETNEIETDDQGNLQKLKPEDLYSPSKLLEFQNYYSSGDFPNDSKYQYPAAQIQFKKEYDEAYNKFGDELVGTSTMEDTMTVDSIMNNTLTLSQLAVKDRKRIGNLVEQRLNTMLKNESDPDRAMIIRSTVSGSKGLTEQIEKRLNASADVIERLPDYMEQIRSMDNGPIIGRLSQLNPWSTSVATYKAELQSLIPEVARGLFSEVGVLTDNDIKLYSQTLPKLTNTDEQANMIGEMLLKVAYRSYINSIVRGSKSGINMSRFLYDYDDMKSALDKLENPGGNLETTEDFVNLYNNLGQ